MKHTRQILAVLALALGGSAVRAQEHATDAPTIESVQQRIAVLEPAEQAGTLDDESKTKLDLYRQAMESLQAVESRARERQRYVDEEAQTPAELEAVRAELAQPLPELETGVSDDATLADAQAALRQAEADLTAARDTLKNVEDRPQRRSTRRAEILERIADAQASIEQARQEIGALPLPGESPSLTEARTARLKASERALQERIGYLEAERSTYDAQGELLSLQHEQWMRRVEQQQRLVNALQQIVEARQAAEIRRQQEEAQAAALAAHPLVEPIARENVELVLRRDAIQTASEKIQQQVTDFSPDPDQLEQQLDRMMDRVEAVGMTDAVGKLLRWNRGTLIDPALFRRRIRQRQALMAEIEFERLEYNDQYDAVLATREQRVADLLGQLGPAVSPEDRGLIEQELRAKLRTKRDFLRTLNDDLLTYFNRLDALNEKAGRTADLTDQMRAYIDTRILWIRSAAPIQLSDVPLALDALAWLFDPGEWSRIARSAWGGARNRWPTMALVLAAFAVLLGLRPRLRNHTRALGAALLHPQKDTIGRTLVAAGLTVILAATWPAVMWAVGWWLVVVDSDAGGELGLAGAMGLVLRDQAPTLFVLLLLLEACRKQGLAEAHFRWQPQALKLTRRYLAWLLAVFIPAAIVTGVMHQQPNDDWEGSLGRLAFTVAMVALFLFARRVLRPTGGLLDDFMRRHPGGWVHRMRYLWYGLAILTPVALLIESLVGYHYTAVQLTGEVFQSIAVIVVVTLINGLLLRWIVVAQRRLAREEMRKLRAEWEAQKARVEDADGDATLAPEPERVDVYAISEQSRHLLRSMAAFVTFVLLWWIWADMLPAIRFLDEIHLWGAPGEGAELITLRDVLLSVVVVIMTVLIAKNIPGLLEISILQRLPLDRGSQFAISTLVRYAITIVGIVIACGYIGLTWSKVQWLAAAITVGLGFGLQEIFANFVSGLIILFERPIRVGDTVSAGDVHGTITKIRIRATTITDWDRKELVIPNKQFVTGTITNWSLSDAILRLVLPVGIAYGSDTALAEKLLYEVAEEQPLVLDLPAPTVRFNGFGDSSLEFNLRVFIPNTDHMSRVRHELNNAIDQAFRKAGIEIAFPQRDIHVRSIRGEIPISQRGAPASDAPINDED